MIVFVHGVPETAAIWDKVRAAIDEPSVAVALPGFGCPRPEGFTATKDAYVDWLVGELEAIDQPVDLVGHDWGGGFTSRVAMTRGDLVRTWVADLPNGGHPDYVWHDIAQIWQTPGEGEAFIAAQIAMPPEAVAPTFEELGVPADDALALAEGVDATMGTCILDLYRSAVPNSAADWGHDVTLPAPPGLFIHATDDPYRDEALAAEMVALTGTEEAQVEAGHFWPYQAAEAAAEALTAFWSRHR